MYTGIMEIAKDLHCVSCAYLYYDAGSIKYATREYITLRVP